MARIDKRINCIGNQIYLSDITPRIRFQDICMRSGHVFAPKYNGRLKTTKKTQRYFKDPLGIAAFLVDPILGNVRILVSQSPKNTYATLSIQGAKSMNVIRSNATRVLEILKALGYVWSGMELHISSMTVTIDLDFTLPADIDNRYHPIIKRHAGFPLPRFKIPYRRIRHDGSLDDKHRRLCCTISKNSVAIAGVPSVDSIDYIAKMVYLFLKPYRLKNGLSVEGIRTGLGVDGSDCAQKVSQVYKTV
jgi:hypothetical protein